MVLCGAEDSDVEADLEDHVAHLTSWFANYEVDSVKWK